MSLRYPAGAPYEREPNEAEQRREKEARRKFHCLVRYGRAYGCRCGKIFQQPVRNQAAATMLIELHHLAIELAREDQAKGVSNYGSGD